MLRVSISLLVCIAVVLGDGDVFEWTDSDFHDNVAEHDLVLVKFYAPWCGHCKSLAPEFAKAATTLAANDPPIALAKVDCTAETTVCGKYGVSGYPTLKIFRSGELAEDYNGPRQADGIVKYMRSKAGPSAKVLSSVAEMEKFLASEEHSVVGFFKEEEGELYKSFKKLADSLSEDYRFAYSTDAAVLEKYAHSDDVVIYQPKRLQNKFEDSEQKYDETPALPQLKSWLHKNIHGLVGHRTSGNAAQFSRPLVVAYFAVDYAKNPKGTHYWRNRVLKVAKKFQDADKKVFFAISSGEEFQQEMSEFGMDGASADKPTIAARDASDRKYVMSGEFTMDALEKFTNDLLDDKLDPYLKSEPIPEDSDEAVQTLVAKNFDQIVNDDSKDVLIEFYAPWCGHCKNLAPKYEELAQKLKDEDNIVIAKMDATANDVPKPYEVKGFPTLFFSPAKSKKSPKKYEGGREVKDFIKYLAAESTEPMKTYDRSGKKKKSSKSEL